MRVALVNRKGGVAKTTSAVFLAAAFSGHGKTLLVDCDPQGSALSWAAAAEEAGGQGSLFFASVGLPLTSAGREVEKLAGDYDHVVLDTPPGEEKISRSALMAADTAVVVAAPSALDLDRLRPTLELVAEVEQISSGLDYWILLTRVRRITREARDAREVLEEVGLPVMAAEIPLLSRYSDAFGRPFEDALDYAEVCEQLLSGAGYATSGAGAGDGAPPDGEVKTA